MIFIFHTLIKLLQFKVWSTDWQVDIHNKIIYKNNKIKNLKNNQTNKISTKINITERNIIDKNV